MRLLNVFRQLGVIVGGVWCVINYGIKNAWLQEKDEALGITVIVARDLPEYIEFFQRSVQETHDRFFAVPDLEEGHDPYNFEGCDPED